MNKESSKPIVLVFAGPNGSGKTTITKRLSVAGIYINADDLKKTYGMTDLEAAQHAESLRNKLLEKCVSFTFETVLSTDRNLNLMIRAKDIGYEVRCIYVLTSDANINAYRVKHRHALGGHDVPTEKIEYRYHKALALLPQVIEVCDVIYIYDNSDEPYLIYSKENGIKKLFPNKIWSKEALEKLIKKK
ncbi:zeta toxin family protein [Sedimentibacter sp.]|uniref:zeta toxin family protein n=1 Tax=Sedimentibacter sp. TaxID=1960295 RepID=UPI0028AD143E|nr:zeta toxin family protein [Sedimentibacter sp.]